VSISTHKVTLWLIAHKYIVLIIGVISLSLAMVAVSLQLYHASGTAQLDLSHPQYRSLRESIQRDQKGTLFSSNGEMSQTVVDEFLSAYDLETLKIKNYNAYGGDPLSDAQLGIE